MRLLNELIAAGEKHKATNKMVATVFAVLFTITGITALATTGVIQYIFIGLSIITGGVLARALYQATKLASHQKQLEARIPYAETEQFDQKTDRFKKLTLSINKRSSRAKRIKAHRDVKEYVDLLRERVKPFVEKGEKNLTYDERIEWTLNQKTLLEVQPLLRKLENFLPNDHSD